MNDIAQILFGKSDRTAILRYFALHIDRPGSFDDLQAKTKIKKKALAKEVAALKRSKVVQEQKTKQGPVLAVTASFREPLRMLFSDSSRTADEQLVQRVRKAGPLKFLACGGSVIGDDIGMLDVLIVGSLQPKTLERALKPLEAQLGAELRCALFNEEEFLHRVDVRDRLIFDLFNGAHKVLFDKLKHPLLPQ